MTEVSFSEDEVSPCLAVVQAVAESEGVDPLDLPPLYDAVDASLLDALFGEDNPVQLKFLYQGYEITVLDNECVAQKVE